MPPLPTARPFRPLLRLPVPWVFVLGYLLALPLHLVLRMPLASEARLPVQLTGAAFFLAGAVIAGWPLLLFRRERTTTTPGETSRSLVTGGPYRFTRNPMYVGLTLAYLGEMGILVQAAPLITLLLVLAYVNWIVIPLEEARLGEAFGDEYASYCSRVGRWL